MGEQVNRTHIESKAQKVLGVAWRARRKLWPLSMPPPIAMLDPEKIAEALKITYVEYESLGRFGYRGEHYETAGMIDRATLIIAISTAFPRSVQRFTAAHELGHYALHEGEMMHRDRPVNSLSGGRRSPVDQEADYFAACLLAPARLVTEEFLKRFDTTIPLALTDGVAYELCRSSAHALMRAGPASYEFAAAVASATQFGGQRFTSLAEEFGVSVSVMAIRVRELELIEE
jgi:IrrE N-terminal-like domain